MQRAGALQETPVRSLIAVPGLGVGSTRHLVPFQLSANVIVTGPVGVCLRLAPAATQLFAVGQDTLVSALSMECVSARGKSRQLVPFHASASVPRPLAVKASPTAMQRAGRGQLMLKSSLLPGLGIASTRHLLPSHPMASGWLGPALLA
jgi:hypothetical protein